MGHHGDIVESPTVFHLRSTMFAPRRARRFVYELGDPAGLPDGVVDDAALVLGELVTEGTRQSHGDIDVVVEVANPTITVRVRDARASSPRLPGHVNGPARNSGTVRRLAASWGCARHVSGWEVWAVIRPRPEHLPRVA